MINQPNRALPELPEDQKSNLNAVDSYLLDDNGKIKELDLIKK